VRQRAWIVLVAVALLSAAPSAFAGTSTDLWATVNLCNTPEHPYQMGVRGRMPGDGKREKMYMRFTAQYRAGDGTWQTVDGTARSPWIYVGSALFSNEEGGFTFSFDQPKPGEQFVMRGRADFQWRARKRRNGKVRIVVVRRAVAITSAGHPSHGAEPPGFSAATCMITGPSA
jgi:hypothetical protein